MTPISINPDRKNTKDSKPTTQQTVSTFRKIHALYLNARSILNKLAEFNCILNSHSYDFIFVTETWLKPFHKDSFIIDALHYNILRHDRVNHRNERGGGVAVIFKNELSNKLCKVDIDKYGIDSTCNNGFEVIAFDYYQKNNVFSRFVCIYLPPHNAKSLPIVSNLLKLLRALICKCEFYLFGDFNFNDIIWKHAQISAKSPRSSDFLSFLSSYNLTQLVIDSTHNKGGTLDLVITSCPDKVQSLDIREPLTISNDHNMIEISIQATTQKIKSTEAGCARKRNFFLANYSEINNFLSTIDWSCVFNGTNDIDSLYENFLSFLNESIQRYVPFCGNKRKPRLPSHIRNLLKQKKHYYKRSKSDSSAKSLYKKYAKLYKKEVNQHSRQLEQKVIFSGNRNSLYSYINKKLHTTSSIPPLKNKNEELILDATHKANIFNENFIEVFITDNNITPRMLNPSKSNQMPQMPEILITPTDVRNAIKHLKNQASRTPEDIPAIFIKNTAEHLIYPLTTLFNLSLKLGKVPTLWKRALIVPIHKKGLKNNPKNYRPISMTSIFCRILERIIHTKVMEHLACHNLLSDTQHGFIAKRSTLSQHIEILNRLTENYDENTQLDMIYLDFSKAFDRVSHPKLLHVLHNFKLTPTLVNWIKDYLTNRKQATVVDNCMSDFKYISSGVPQGSVLGPLMFLMYIDDLLKTLDHNCPSTKVYAFADDVKLMSKQPTDLQQGLTIVENWAKNWQLTIQPAKSENITFSRGHHPSSFIYNINGNPIEKTTTVKDLGIKITENLDWTPYLQQIKLKAERLIYIILRSFKTNNLDIYKMAYKTYIRPLLEYNTSAWTSNKKGDIDLIESIQRTYTKKVCQRLNLKFNNYLERLDLMNMNSLEYRRLEFDLILLYKILHKMIYINLQDTISISNILSTYNFRRHSLQLTPHPLCNTNMRYNFFSNRIIQIWNKLPEHLISSKSLEIFKISLHKFNLRTVFTFRY